MSLPRPSTVPHPARTSRPATSNSQCRTGLSPAVRRGDVHREYCSIKRDSAQVLDGHLERGAGCECKSIAQTGLPSDASLGTPRCGYRRPVWCPVAPSSPRPRCDAKFRKSLMLPNSLSNETVHVMKKLSFALLMSCGLVSACAHQAVLSQAPPPGSLPTGRTVLVADGSCPPGQVREFTGSLPGVDRPSRCVPNPTR